jgi:hypothetical protein
MKYVKINWFGGMIERTQKYSKGFYYYPGGLCNQLYALASACMIAKKLKRAIIIPNVIIRKNALDFQKSPSDIKKLKKNFNDFFDVQFFEDNVAIPTQEDCSQLRNLSESPNILMNQKQISSYEINNHFSKFEKYDILSVDNPFLAIYPKDIKDKEFMLNVFNSIIPSKRLMEHVREILKGILDQNESFNVLHFRSEADWLKEYGFGKNKPEHLAEMLNKKTYLKKLPLYIAAKDNPDYLKHFQKYFKVFYKTKLIPDIEKTLDFEEKAIIDRFICLGSEYFIGNHKSTFSRSIVNQRKDFNSNYYTLDKKKVWHNPLMDFGIKEKLSQISKKLIKKNFPKLYLLIKKVIKITLNP